MATFWVTFCLSKSIARFQKWFDVDVLGFQIELCCRYLGLFLTWQFFGLFREKFGNFFF
jgi:hypothetical protein